MGDRPVPVAQVSASSGPPVASSPEGTFLSPSPLERHLPFACWAGPGISRCQAVLPSPTAAPRLPVHTPAPQAQDWVHLSLDTGTITAPPMGHPLQVTAVPQASASLT